METHTNLKPWQPGQSGNPNGRPVTKIHPSPFWPEVGPGGRTTSVGLIVGLSAVSDLLTLPDQAAHGRCCCWGCGHVGNAPALSKRSVMSTAVFANIPSRQTVIGER